MKNINKKTIIAVLLSFIVIISIYYFFIKEKEYTEINTNFSILNEEEEYTKEENKNKIIIYITGAVANEGIYELDENSRIADVIDKAGGITEEANINNINLAFVLEDGVKIYIPKKGDNSNEIKDDTNTYISKRSDNIELAQSTKNNNTNNKVNINTANQTELETLPGIGASIATKIISYRNKNGKFINIEDIKKVNGIGESNYEKIKDQIMYNFKNSK